MQEIRFDDLRPFLLLANGNRIFKLPVENMWVVLKHYRGSRSQTETLRKSMSSWLVGQTSYRPRTRCRTERECLAVWESYGFQTFQLVTDLKLDAPGCREGEYNILAFEEGPRLVDFLNDTGVSQETKRELFKTFLAEWGRRHELAIREKEPRLVHENGDIKHVQLTDRGMVWFDFEVAYRSRAGIGGYISREIASYLKSLLRMVDPVLSEILWHDTIEHYPAPSRLKDVRSFFFRHPNLIHRTCRWIDRSFRERGRKRLNKYEIATKLARSFPPLG